MKDLASGQVSDDFFLKNLWLQRLPRVLAVSDDELDKIAVLGNKVSEISVPLNDSIVAEVSENNE